MPDEPYDIGPHVKHTRSKSGRAVHLLTDARWVLSMISSMHQQSPAAQRSANVQPLPQVNEIHSVEQGTWPHS